MARPARPWFRFYVEAFSDRKLLRLTPAQRWIWVAVLGAARESCVPGSLFIAPDVPMTDRELARYADVREKDIARALNEMAALGMVDRSDGVLSVRNWNDRQFESDDTTARTAKHRSKERSNDVPGNTPETEVETETDVGPLPPAAEATTKHERAKPKRLIPADWEPSDDDLAWCQEHYPQLDPWQVAREFRTYWQGCGKPMADWSMTFRNRVQKVAGWSKQTGPARTFL